MFSAEAIYGVEIIKNAKMRVQASTLVRTVSSQKVVQGELIIHISSSDCQHRKRSNKEHCKRVHTFTNTNASEITPEQLKQCRDLFSITDEVWSLQGPRPHNQHQHLC